MKKSVLLFLLLASIFGTLRAQEPPGVVINHIPKSEGKYIGSPAICMLPDGSYVVAHDIFGPKSNSGTAATTILFKSSDRGATWSKLSEITGQFWSNLFYYNNDLYIMGTYSGHGNIVIRKSADKGQTWSSPENASNGLLFKGNYHTAPTPVAIYNGRIWRAFEDANGLASKLPNRYGVLMISAPLGSDLLNAASWTKTNCLLANPDYLPGGKFLGWLEGGALVTKENRLVNVLRVHVHPGTEEYLGIVSTIKNRYDSISFNPASGLFPMPGGAKKFTIRYDSVSKRYWTLANNISDEYDKSVVYPASVRNSLALLSSADLQKWELHKIILYHPDRFRHAFQYVDWEFDNADIVFVSRTAYNNADSYHNANYLTFHRVENFREVR